jgi:hypothetical protein
MLTGISICFRVNQASEQRRDFSRYIVAAIVIEQGGLGLPVSSEWPHTSNIAPSAI